MQDGSAAEPSPAPSSASRAAPGRASRWSRSTGPATPPRPSLPARAGSPFATGVSSRQVTDQSAPEKTAASRACRWSRCCCAGSSCEPTASTWDWGGLDASLADARDRHYRLIVRIMCGADAPDWLATDPDHPVQFLDLLSNDASNSRYPGEMLVPEPWDPNLAWHYANLMDGAGRHISAVPTDPAAAGPTTSSSCRWRCRRCSAARWRSDTGPAATPASTRASTAPTTAPPSTRPSGTHTPARGTDQQRAPAVEPRRDRGGVAQRHRSSRSRI